MTATPAAAAPAPLSCPELARFAETLKALGWDATYGDGPVYADPGTLWMAGWREAIIALRQAREGAKG